MSDKIRRLTRARDVRADLQFDEVVSESDLPPVHSDTHKATGTDPISPSDIGAETPENAQNKVDTHENKDNPHSASQIRAGGPTADRPSSPEQFEFYFDTDLGKPIYYFDSIWVDATGTTV